MRVPHRARHSAAVLLAIASLIVASIPASAQSDTTQVSVTVTSTCTDTTPSAIAARPDGVIFPDRDPDNPDHADRIIDDDANVLRVVVNANDCAVSWSVTATVWPMAAAGGSPFPWTEHLRIGRRTVGCVTNWCRSSDSSPVESSLATVALPAAPGWSAMTPASAGPSGTASIGGGTIVEMVYVPFRLMLEDLPANLDQGTYEATLAFTLTTVEP